MIIPLFLCLCLCTSLPAVSRQAQGDAWTDLYSLSLDQPLPAGFKNIRADDIHAIMTFGLAKAMLYKEQSGTQAHYLALWDKAVERIENLPDTDPRQSHYLADLYMSRALLHFREDNILRGGWQIRKAIRLLSQISDDFPRYYDHLPLYGLLQGALETVPDQYQWALPTLGITVEAKDGRTIMQEGLNKATKDHKQKGEYLMALADMYLFENPALSTYRLEKLLLSQPNHKLAHHMLAMLYLKDFNAKDALVHLGYLEKLYPDTPYSMPSVYYMRAEALLRKGNYPEAIQSFDRFLEINEGSHLVKDAYYKQGLAWYILKQEADMMQAFKNAVELGEASTASDKYARKIASGEEVLPKAYLVEARLRTDGGYLEEADSILDLRIDTSSHKGMPVNEATEWVYRKARVAHLKGDTGLAELFYDQTVTIQVSNQYYAPNACLQLGYLHQESAPEEARAYFKKAIEYQGHPYEPEIEQKAKAALKELPE